MRHRIKKIPNLSIKNHLLHSDKSAYFYKHSMARSIPPILPIFALLLFFSFLLNPTVNTNSTYATTTESLGNGASISLTILNNNVEIIDNGEVSVNVDAGRVTYIDNIIRVNTIRIGRYYVGIQAAEGSSNKLTNEAGAEIDVVGDNVSTDFFGDNTWGYALTDSPTANSDTLRYNTLPAYSAANSLQYQSPANPADGNHDLKLTFAAKIRADKPSGHYKTKAMVSVAAEASQLVTSWNDLKYLQEMTPEACSGGNTTGKTLTDKRDSQTYTVAKLRDNNCWMTKNMNNPTGRSHSDTTYGGYYNWTNAKAVCNGISNYWALPSKEQYETLANGLSGGTLTQTPYNFQYGGYFSGSVQGAGTQGYYWSATEYGTSGAYSINLVSTGLRSFSDNTAGVYMVRCIAK